MNVNLELGAGAPDVVRHLKEMRDGLEQLRQKEQELNKAQAERAASGQRAHQELHQEAAQAKKDLQELKIANEKLAAIQKQQGQDAVAAGNKANEAIERQVRTVKTLEEALKNANAKNASPAVVNNLTAAIEKQRAALAQLKAASTGAGGLLSPEEVTRLAGQLNAAKNDMEALGVVIGHAKQQLTGMDAGTNEFVALQKEISSAEGIMRKFTEGTEDATEGQNSLKVQLRELTMQMAEMKLRGEDNTEAYARLRAEAGELQDTIGDVREEIALAGSDTGGFDNLINVANTLTGGFAIAQGAAALFGEESEDVQQALLKVNAAMSILNGLQAVQAELARRDSILRKGMIAIQEMWNAKIIGGTVAQRALNAALLLSGIGVVIGLVAVVIKLYKDWTAETEKQAQKQKLLNDVMEGARGEYEQAIAAVNRVRNAFAEARAGIISKKEALAIYNNTLGDSIGRVSSLEAAEANLNAKADTYINYTLKKAIANQALQQSAAKAVEAQILLMKGDQGATDEMGFLDKMGSRLEKWASGGQSTTLDDAIRKQKETIENLKKEAEDLKGIASDAQASADKLGKSLGIDITGTKEAKTSKPKTQKDSTTEDRKKEQDALKAFLKQQEDARVESIQETAERERAALIAGFEKQQETLKEGYDTLLKSKYLSEAQKTELTRSYEAQRLSISASYGRKATELEKQIAEAILATKSAGQKVMLELDADSRKKQLQEVEEQFRADREALENSGMLTEDAMAKLLERRKKRELAIEVEFQKSQIDAQEDAALRSLELMDVSGKDAAQKTKAKEELKLQITKEYAARTLNMLLRQYGLEGQIMDDGLKEYQKYLAERKGKPGETMGFLDFLGVGKNLPEQDRAKIERLVGQMQEAAYESANTETGRQFFQKIMGLDDQDMESLDSAFSAIQSSFSTITSIMEEETQAQIDLIDQRIAKIDELANAQQANVDREKDLMEKGLANTYEAEKERLATIAKSKDDELAQREQLNAKLADIRKTEAAARAVEIGAKTAETTVSLTLAMARVTENFSKIPFVGVILALAAVGTLVSGFIQIKNTLAAANRPPQYKYGGSADLKNLLKGQPSHEQRGVGLYNEVTGQKIAEFEGDEKLFLVNKGSATGKYEPLLEEINRDKVTAATLLRYLRPSDIHLLEPAKKQVLERSKQGHAIADSSTTNGLQELTAYNRRIAQSNEAMLEIERARKEEIIHSDGTRVIRSHNHTRIIKP